MHAILRSKRPPPLRQHLHPPPPAKRPPMGPHLHPRPPNPPRLPQHPPRQPPTRATEVSSQTLLRSHPSDLNLRTHNLRPPTNPGAPFMTSFRHEWASREARPLPPISTTITTCP